MPSTPRLWLLSEDGSRLIQLQSDLIAYNWRRSPEGVPLEESYPRYTHLRGEFAQHIGRLAELAAEEDEHALLPNWCEVTYINHIGGKESGAERPPLRDLLRGVDLPARGGFLPESEEDAQVALRFIIPSDSGPPGED